MILVGRLNFRSQNFGSPHDQPNRESQVRLGTVEAANRQTTVCPAVRWTEFAPRVESAARTDASHRHGLAHRGRTRNNQDRHHVCRSYAIYLLFLEIPNQTSLPSNFIVSEYSVSFFPSEKVTESVSLAI